jgi:hypothetical protein
MKYLCTNCGYVYDESAGDESEEIECGTRVDDLDCCPVCFEVDPFFQVKEEVIYIDENTRDRIELEHFIKINYKNRKIEVIV